MKDISPSQERRVVKRGNSTIPVIGMTEYVSVANHYFKIPAKIDTGADSSSIWASNINITSEDALEFTLFDNSSKFYDGHVFHFSKGNYEVSALHNSTGDKQFRYRVYLTIGIADKKIRASITLADRSKNSMPILIGRNTISNKFLVDVTFNPTGRKKSHKKLTERLNEEMRKNPRLFHSKYQPSNPKGKEKK